MRSASSKSQKKHLHTSTTPERELQSLLQISDSFFPVGGYSLSFGAETLSQLNMLNSKEDLESLLGVFLAQLAGSDCVALRAAYSAAARLDLVRVSSVDRKLASFKNVRENYDASRRTGRALFQTVGRFAPARIIRDYARLVQRGKAPGLYPICLALVCRSLRIEEDDAVALLLYTMSVSVVAAAIRLGNIDHLEAQEILHSSKIKASEAALKSSGVSWEEMRMFSPILDIMSMQHVYLSSRMFAC